ncbi:MAG: peptide chain release factor N(5)-glutamine methyltransferase [Candidatus Margulisbacteria bacterium]|jgi:release factor glutamine methyltransferase|nr:peptide chain release factor N(5)-glutamine methyltransferase [Candidatus Margulisiibacteriota bacterium]
MIVKEKLWTILDILKWSENFLREKGIPSPRHDAEALLGFVLDLPRLELYLRFDQPLSAAERGKYKTFLRRRARREPLQYITGAAYFLGEKFKTAQDVLIPRYDTEILAETVLKTLADNARIKRIIDVGCGSGILPVILAKKTGLKIYALDIADAALELARENAAAHGVADRIEFLRSDLLAALIHRPAEEVFLVSNPPYISPAEYLTLEPEVRDYEPKNALLAEDEGLFFYKKILAQSVMLGEKLKGVFFEVGFKQAGAVSGLLRKRFGAEVFTVLDIGGKARVVYTLL